MHIIRDRKEKIHYDCYDSPIGRLFIQSTDNSLVGLDTIDEKIDARAIEILGVSETEFSHKVKVWLDRFFNGEKVDVNEIPVEYLSVDSEILIDPENFPSKVDVYEAMRQIPYGEAVSYGELAEKVFQDKSYARYVGAICRQNQIIIIIPCHRVINSNKTLGGYRLGTNTKEQLLLLEGNNGYKKTKTKTSKKEEGN